MSSIPLQKFREIAFPLTPKSTMNFWAKLAYFRNEGPLAGRISKIRGRWYVQISEDCVVNGIKEQIRESLSQN
jgi:hypothetical protein